MERVVTRAIILDKDRKVLLGKRARGMGAGQWALVGGKPDEGESVENAVTREVNEELGVLFVNPTFWKEEVDTETDPKNPWIVHYFWGTAEGGLTSKQDELGEVNYFNESELQNLDIAFNHRKILLQFFQDAI